MMLIEADQLAYAYEEAGQSHTVLHRVSLGIATGERVALLGRSGSGKSTLLNLLGGIDSPTAGTVQLRGESMAHLGEPALTHFRRQHIGYIYQRFNLVPTLTAAENIALPLDLAGASRESQAQAVMQWLDAVGLGGRGDTFPDLLSGGEQQRVAIARALIHRPALVLADEPTGSLDARTGNQVLDLLFQRAAGEEQALLVVTHSDEVAARADRVLRLEDGQLRDTASEGRA